MQSLLSWQPVVLKEFHTKVGWGSNARQLLYHCRFRTYHRAARGDCGTVLPERFVVDRRHHLKWERSRGKKFYAGCLRGSSTARMVPSPLLLSPTANAAVVLVSFGLFWMMSYVLDWLHVLEAGSSAGEQMPLLEDPTSLATVQFPSIFAPAEKYISLVVPAYNEEARLSSTLDETLAYLQDRAKQDRTFTYEIIIVDDGSTDQTVKLAFEYVKKYKLDVLRIIKQGSNHGKGAAVKQGILCSRGQLLLMLDADGATKITELGKLESEMKQKLNKMAARGNQEPPSNVTAAELGQVPLVAFGSRAYLEKHALATRKWYRNLLMKGFHLLVLLVAGPGIRDTQCGFKMFTRSAARQLFLNMRLRRFAFDVELVYLCKRLCIPMLEVAVTWTEIPGSKVRPLSMVHMAFELVLVRLGYGFHVWKMHQRVGRD